MKKVKPKPKIKRRKVKFSLELANAHEVILVGDFNHWDPKTHPMKNDGSGVWNRTLMLPAGKYEYKFLIDGVWKEDPKNDQRCSNCFGTLNSVLNI
jgi:1,4-alpha-glucan branching enzyme